MKGIVITALFVIVIINMNRILDIVPQAARNPKTALFIIVIIGISGLALSFIGYLRLALNK